MKRMIARIFQPQIKKRIRCFFLVIFPLMTLTFIILPVYGELNKWDLAEKVLAEKYPSDFSMMVGASTGGYKLKNLSYDHRQRSYIVLHNTHWPKVVSIAELETNGKRKIEVMEESFLVVVLIVLFFILCVFISLKYSVPFFREVLLSRRLSAGE
jgi:hypothetical protein